MDGEGRQDSVLKVRPMGPAASSLLISVMAANEEQATIMTHWKEHRLRRSLFDLVLIDFVVEQTPIDLQFVGSFGFVAVRFFQGFCD